MATTTPTPVPKDVTPTNLTSVARGGALSLAGSVVFAVSNFLLFFVIAKQYNPVVAGAFFTATAIFQILTRVAELGVSTGLIRHLSTARVHREVHLFGPILFWAIIPVAVVGVILSVAIFGFADALSGLIPGDPDAGEDGTKLVATFFRLLAPFVPIAALYQALVNGTRGFSTMRPFVAIERLAKASMQLVFVAIVSLVDIKTDYLVIAWAVPIVIVTIPTVVWFRNLYRTAHRGVVPTRKAPDRHERVAAFWRFTSGRSVASIAQGVVQFIDIPLVALFVGVDAAGIYGVASRFLQVGTFASLSVSQVMQPKISEAFARKDHEDADQLYKFSTGWLVLITAPIYLMVALFPEPLLAIFGPEYTVARSVLVILAMATLLGSFCGAADTVLIMGGSSFLSLINLVTSAAVNIGLNIFFLNVLGWNIEGAAVAWAVSILLQKLLPMLQVRKTLHLSPIGLPSVLTGWAALLTVGVIGVIGRVFLGDGLPLAVGAGIVGALLYLFVLSRRAEETGLDILRQSFGGGGRGIKKNPAKAAMPALGGQIPAAAMSAAAVATTASATTALSDTAGPNAVGPNAAGPTAAGPGSNGAGAAPDGEWDAFWGEANGDGTDHRGDHHGDDGGQWAAFDEPGPNNSETPTKHR